MNLVCSKNGIRRTNTRIPKYRLKWPRIRLTKMGGGGIHTPLWHCRPLGQMFWKNLNQTFPLSLHPWLVFRFKTVFIARTRNAKWIHHLRWNGKERFYRIRRKPYVLCHNWCAKRWTGDSIISVLINDWIQRQIASIDGKVVYIYKYIS